MRENVMRRAKRSVKNVLVEALQTLGRSGGLAFATAFVVVAAPIEHLCAQGYPSRSITVIVPYPAGGPADTVGRIMVEGMRKSLGQPLIIENVAGASGSVGVGRVARAAPDGYTLILGNWAANALNGAIFTLSYDLMNDFTPVSWLANEPQFIVAKKSMPANNLKELVAWLKANPDKATWGTAGPGGVAHVVGVFFQRQTGTRFQFVPYRGLGPAMQDLIAGRVQYICDSVSTSKPQIEGGHVKAIATTGLKRSPALPNIPTAKEQGLAFDVLTWQGLFLAKDTPAPIVKQLSEAMSKALDLPSLRGRFEPLGEEIPAPDRRSAEYFSKFVAGEIARWSGPIKASGVTVE
jgi:tripartite-type tricarboxylate transporter receptor subunit TctC